MAFERYFSKIVWTYTALISDHSNEKDGFSKYLSNFASDKFRGFIYLTPGNSVVSVKILKTTHGVRRVLRSSWLRTITVKSYRLNFHHTGVHIEGVK